MQPEAHGDQSERLSELLILSSALYFKMTAWHEIRGPLPENVEACRLALHLTSIDLAREEQFFAKSPEARKSLVKRGLAELILGIEELCGNRFIQEEPPSCSILRDRVTTLNETMQRLD